MTLVLPALLVLVVAALGLAWFLRANPSALARLARIGLGVLGAAGLGLLLVFFALIAHFAYHAYDEVLHCIGLLERRGALPTDTVVRYIQQDYTPLSVDI